MPFNGQVELLQPLNVDVAILPINGRRPERRVQGNFWGREAAQLAPRHRRQARPFPATLKCSSSIPKPPTSSSQHASRSDNGVKCSVADSDSCIPRTRDDAMKKWKIAGINFDHFHMGDLLRMAHEHPSGGDRRHLRRAARAHGRRDPQLRHSRRSRLHRLAALPGANEAGSGHPLPRRRPPRRVGRTCCAVRSPLIVEKPFAASLAEADRMIAALCDDRQAIGNQLAAALVPSHTLPPSGSLPKALSASSSSTIITAEIAARSGTSPTRSSEPPNRSLAKNRRAGFTSASMVAVLCWITPATAPRLEPGSWTAGSPSR